VPDTLAVTNSVNSGNGRPEAVCHLLSSCVHASITGKSDCKVFEWSDKFQRCAIVREGGNRRSIPLLKKTMTLVLSVSSLNTWNVYSQPKDDGLCSAPPIRCRNTQDSTRRIKIRKTFQCVGIRWLGGRSLHTTRSIAQKFLGVVLNVSSHIAFGRWGRLVGLLYSCTERHAFGCISNLCGRAWHLLLFSRGNTCKFRKWVASVFLYNVFLDQFLWYLCSTLWTDGLKPF
jgi:hypothetical protein